MTTILLTANISCFVVQALLIMAGVDVFRWLALSLSGLKHGLVYQLVTFQFMHGGILHLLGNMLTLYFFGRGVEAMFGSRGMLRLYLLSGTAGGLLQVLLAAIFPAYFGAAVVGASAGIFGLIAAYAASQPNAPVMIFPIPVSFPIKILLLFEAILAVFGLFGFYGSGMAHGAHLGGMLAGVGFIVWTMKGYEFRWPWRKPTARPTMRFMRSPRQRNEEPSGTEEFISREVDPILDKISAHGIHSLTDREREILEKARNRMANR